MVGVLTVVAATMKNATRAVIDEAFSAAMQVWMQRVADQVQDTPEGHIRAFLDVVDPIIRDHERAKWKSARDGNGPPC